MHHPIDRITHATAFVTPVVEHWVELEIAQWVHHEGLIRRPIAPRSYISVLKCKKYISRRTQQVLFPDNIITTTQDIITTTQVTVKNLAVTTLLTILSAGSDISHERRTDKPGPTTVFRYTDLDLCSCPNKWNPRTRTPVRRCVLALAGNIF